MKSYMILHYGFEQPTKEEMQAWNLWFESIAERQLDRNGFAAGRELTQTDCQELPFMKDSITGYTMIRAESLDEATEIASQCPIVASMRVYEIRSA